MKTCPECAEQVQDAASVCRFCGHRFSGYWTPLRIAIAAGLIVVAILVVVAVAGGEIDKQGQEIEQLAR